MIVSNVKITKRINLGTVCNEKCHNFYYNVRLRIYFGDSKYLKCSMLIWFDIFDVQEYFDKDNVTQKDINDYLNEMIFVEIDTINGANLTVTQNFIKQCNEKIKEYNSKL